ncbi:LolA family protein [Citricoccus zhacaiensis]
MASQQRNKWIPAVAAPVIVGVIAFGGGLTANAQADLPDRSAEEVLALAAGHHDTSFSGTVEASFALGLPPLPTRQDPERGEPEGSSAAGATGAVPEGLAEAFSLLSGTHEARVFADGADRLRMQVFDGTDERNVVRNGQELWAYDSAEGRAMQVILPQGPDGASTGHGMARAPEVDMTPERLAEKALAGLDPTTEVTVGEDTRVAGRDAYTLRLDPRTPDTLVEDVTLAVDAATGAPLSVRVRAVGQEDPAISVEYTSYSTETPDASLFEFTPPAGAEVERVRPDGSMWPDAHRSGPRGAGGHPAGGDAVLGSGWDAVAVIPAEKVPAGLTDSPLLNQYAIDSAAGRVLSTPLATVLLADDGRVLAGPVPLERLLDVASSG